MLKVLSIKTRDFLFTTNRIASSKQIFFRQYLAIIHVFYSWSADQSSQATLFLILPDWFQDTTAAKRQHQFRYFLESNHCVEGQRHQGRRKPTQEDWIPAGLQMLSAGEWLNCLDPPSISTWDGSGDEQCTGVSSPANWHTTQTHKLS